MTMKPRLYLSLGLVAVLLVSACAPAGTEAPIATSHGPDLHPTDPATVNLASGQIQFVEFFRFT